VGAVLVEAAAAGEFRLISIPVVPIAAATVFSTGACILATGIPLRRINRISIVDAMGSVE
ncbi:MAG: hypothetical protein K2P13_01355, partial [Lachnospiraceae bacterium]|nr:hypothetical protein [Lachnospiraceae bacterium]